MTEGFVAVWLLCGLIAAMIGGSKKMGVGVALFLGLLLGLLGLIIVAVSESKPEPSTLDRIERRPDAAGWHTDPLGRFDSRWYDGSRWTQHVGRVSPDGGRVQLEDPL